MWIKRRQAYESLLRYKQGKIRNKSNLRRTAQRCGIKTPLHLKWKEIKERLKVCEERCEYFSKHGHAYRRRHLQNRLSITRSKRDAEAEQKILEIIRRERERALWRRLNYSMAKRKGRSVRVVQVEQADGSILEATNQRTVQETIWDNIHGQRFYLAEQAFVCKGRLRGEFGYMATSPAADRVLDGSYSNWEGVEDGTKDLFEEIAILRNIVGANSVDTRITPKRWKERWRKAKETTSSSESGLHFGHYIAGAQSKVISQHDAIKTTLCNNWGFALDRWKRGLSCMIEKSPGCCRIKNFALSY